MPSLGLGTWDLRGDTCLQAVELALKLGYRHIDTAEMYGNETEIGKAIARSGVPREELFVTTKVWTNHHLAPDFKKAAEDSLKRLGLDHVDLLLIHWPNPAVKLSETMGALCSLAKEGKTLAIGVSNFDVKLFKEAVFLASVPVSCNQITYNLESQPGGRDFLASLSAGHLAVGTQRTTNDAGRTTVLCSYSPLGRGRFLNRPELIEVGKKHGKTPAQVALRWLVQQEGVAAIPKATGERHLRQNLEIFDFTLDIADLSLLEKLGK